MHRPRERRRPQMPNALPKMLRSAWCRSRSLTRASDRGVLPQSWRGRGGRIVVSPNGVWKLLCRHGLNTRAKRLGLIAGYAAPYEPRRDPAPEQHIDVDRPGALVGIDCFYVGRLKGTEGAIWQLTAIDISSSYAWAELVICKQGKPTAEQTSKLAQRVARDLKAAGGDWSGCSQTTARVQGGLQQEDGRPERWSHPDSCRQAADQRARRGATQDHPRRVLATRVRALPLPPLQRSTTRAGHLLALLQHRSRPQRPPPPRDASPQTSFTVPKRCRQNEPHLSAQLGGHPHLGFTGLRQRVLIACG